MGMAEGLLRGGSDTESTNASRGTECDVPTYLGTCSSAWYEDLTSGPDSTWP